MNIESKEDIYISLLDGLGASEMKARESHVPFRRRYFIFSFVTKRNEKNGSRPACHFFFSAPISNCNSLAQSANEHIPFSIRDLYSLALSSARAEPNRAASGRAQPGRVGWRAMGAAVRAKIKGWPQKAWPNNDGLIRARNARAR